MKTPNQFIFRDQSRNIEVFMKREDLIHPFVSGNKYRKLKYNLIQAKAENKQTLLTFGGAFSNHIAAVAFAGKENGFKTVGVIRGEELISKVDENPTLSFARKCGMEFEFISREAYREKDFRLFSEKFGDFYVIPEGGTNALAVRGCEEILSDEDSQFQYVCCAVGTGGTIAGIINSAPPNQKILGFPALKGSFLENEIRNFANNENWELINDYHFGGYGKVSPELVSFINEFSRQNKFLLDPVYTAKMVFGVMNMIEKNYFSQGSRILLIHTGGIQGIKGMNIKLRNKNIPIINTDV